VASRARASRAPARGLRIDAPWADKRQRLARQVRFLTTPGPKARLKPVLAPGNVDETMAAPVTVIIAWDTQFHENLPKLFPQAEMRSYFVGNQAKIDQTAFRNRSLQAA
jgi:hypothetical protein